MSFLRNINCFAQWKITHKFFYQHKKLFNHLKLSSRTVHRILQSFFTFRSLFCFTHLHLLTCHQQQQQQHTLWRLNWLGQLPAILLFAHYYHHKKNRDLSGFQYLWPVSRHSPAHTHTHFPMVSDTFTVNSPKQQQKSDYLLLAIMKKGERFLVVNESNR